MAYTYKTVPAPMALLVKSKTNTEDAIRGFSSIINAEGTDGWEFYSMETITTQEPQGCIGGQLKTTNYNMLVFRREQ